MKTRTFATLTALLVSACAWSQTDYETKSGFVDFDPERVFGDGASTIEISLEGPLLSMISGTMKHVDPDLASLLKKLDLIRVHIAPAPADLPEDSKKRIDQAVADLEAKGWDNAMRMIEDGDSFVNALMKMNGDVVEGFVLYVLESSGEAVFVNIVGDIDPDQLGALAAKFMGDDFDTSVFEDIGKNIEASTSPLAEAKALATQARNAAKETASEGSEATLKAAESLWKEAAALEKDGLADSAKRLYETAETIYSSLIPKS